MPGKANLQNADFVTAARLYRELTAADTDDMASINGLAESINMAATEANSDDEVIIQGKSTQLNTAVLFTGDASSINLKFYADMGLPAAVEQTAIIDGDLAAPLGDDRWVLFHEETVTANKLITLQNFPATEIKIIADAITPGTGSVVLTYQRSE